MSKLYIISASLLILATIVLPVYGADLRNVQLVGHRPWFRTIMSDLILQLESEGWSRIRVSDLETDFKHKFTSEIAGKVNYTGGFLMTLGRADTQTSNQNINPGLELVSVIGKFGFHTVRFGFDAEIEVDNGTRFSSTVVTQLTKLEFDVYIRKSTNSDEMTISIQKLSIGTELGHRGEFRPSNDLTDIVGVTFNSKISSLIFSNADRWGIIWSEKLRRIILEDHPFPKICYDCNVLIQN